MKWFWYKLIPHCCYCFKIRLKLTKHLVCKKCYNKIIGGCDSE